MTNEMPRLGYFLTQTFWDDANRLLDFQLSIKPKNMHFHTMSMFHYERIPLAQRELVRTKGYFEMRVSTNLFYGLESEFAVLPYPVPKGNLGLRRYQFFTYPIRVLHYAIGLYLVKLSQDLVHQFYRKNNRIHSAYGGHLVFDEASNKLQLNYDSVWYKPHYQKFRQKVRAEVKGDLTDKVVIRLDIQNYFEEVDVSKLLSLLDEFVKPSINKQMKFDAVVRSEISAFYEFVANKRTGIPQADNDIISAFLGYLLLIFADLKIDDLLNQTGSVLSSHRIYRYMDDIYVILLFKSSAKRIERENFVSELGPKLSDILYSGFNLRLNTKTRLYWLSDEKDVEDLLKNLKRVSPGYELPDDDRKANPQEMVDLIIKQLEKLKRRSLDPTFDNRSDVDDEILKQVYDKSVANLLKKKENLAAISAVFRNFNFDIVAAQPREILILLLLDPTASVEFEKYLCQKTNFSSRDVSLILMYLCQTAFSSNILTARLQSSAYIAEVIRVCTSNMIPSHNPGYFGLRFDQIEKLARYSNVIDQTHLRVVCERRADLSVALNHLLNEVHALCRHLDAAAAGSGKEYNGDRVIDFLVNFGVANTTVLKMRNLFDRRNKNPVSHADVLAWPVTDSEYSDYRISVGQCLAQLL